MKKVNPIKKLEKVVNAWADYGKRYKKLTPYEMNTLISLCSSLASGHEFITFISAVANVAEELGFDVKLDDQGVNYEIRGPK